MRLMKQTKKLFMLMALPMLLGLASCTDNSDNPVSYDGVETEQVPDETLPTDDQMSVLVTADLPTAVLRPFDEGTTGAALVKRLSTVTNEITPETRMVLLRGDLFNFENSTLTQEEMMAIGRLYLNGGYVAIGQQTGEQAGVFGLLFLSAVLSLEQADLEELFDIDYASPTNGDLIYLMQGLGRVKMWQGSVGIGYAYNWVPTRGLLVNAMAMPMLTFVNRIKAFGYATNVEQLMEDPMFWDEDTDADTWDKWFYGNLRIAPMGDKTFNSGMTVNVDARLSVTYNFGRYFLSAYGQFSNMRYRHDSSHGHLNDWFVNTSLGIRL